MNALNKLVLLAFAIAGTLSAQKVAITFDDLPIHGSRPPGITRLHIAQSILATLKREHMPPVYGFVNGIGQFDEPGSWKVLRAWHDAGEPMGNHTWSHMNLSEHTAAEFDADVARNEPLLAGLMGKGAEWHFMRYPYLLEGDTLEKRHAVRAYMDQHGYRNAFVSIDFEDHLWNSPYARCATIRDNAAIATLRASYLSTADEYITVYRRAAKQLYGRDISYILLLHIGGFDAEMLPDLIKLFRDRGFTFITLQEALADPVYQHDPDYPLVNGATLQEQEMFARGMVFPENHKPYKELETACPLPPRKKKKP